MNVTQSIGVGLSLYDFRVKLTPVQNKCTIGAYIIPPHNGTHPHAHAQLPIQYGDCHCTKSYIAGRPI